MFDITTYYNTTQTEFLDQLRRSRRQISVFVLNGFQMHGRIVEFDDNMILLEDETGLQSLIYKHAISTIRPQGRE